MESPEINLSALPTPILHGENSNPAFEALLEKYASKFKLTEAQLEKLKKLRRNGEPLINSANPYFAYEIFGMIKNLGFGETFDFLESSEFVSKPLPSIVLDSKLFEGQQTLYQAEIARIRDTTQAMIKGLYKCKKCGSQYTQDTVSSRQRSSDEATIFQIECLVCGYTWRRG